MRFDRAWAFFSSATTLLAILALAHTLLLFLGWLDGGSAEIFSYYASSQFMSAAFGGLMISFRYWSRFENLRSSLPFFAGSILVANVLENESSFVFEQAGPLPLTLQLQWLIDPREDFAIAFAISLLAIWTIYGLAFAGVRRARRWAGAPATEPSAHAPETLRRSAFPGAVSEPVPEMEASPAAQIVVRILEELISETKSRARFVLIVIFILLVAAVGVIVFAARITSLDVDAGQSVNNLGRKLEKKEKELTDLEEKGAASLARQDQNFSDLTNIDVPVDREKDGKINYSLTDFSNVYSEIRNFVEQETNHTKIDTILELSSFNIFYEAREKEIFSSDDEADKRSDSLDARDFVLPFLIDLRLRTDIGNREIDKFPAEVQLVRNRIDELRLSSDEADKAQQKAAARKGEQTFEFLIASGITRFGIVAIIVYIIQILVSLYRYNMRLSHFYASRMQAFLVGERDGKTIDFFGDFFDSQTVGFGKDVVSPTAELSDLIKKGLEEAAKIATRDSAKAGA